MKRTLTSLLEETVAEQAPAASAAVVGPGSVDELAAAGTADIASDRPASPETIYLWFSMTKIVTATAAMQLVDDEALDLDDPVRRYLPGFPNPRPGWPEVRVRHLLSHSAGLPNPLPVRWVRPAGEPGRDPREFASALLAKHDRLRRPAGERAVYSNLGYIALGEVIAAASGRPYVEQVRARILEPLRMTSTGFDYPGAAEDRSATGYQRWLHPMTPLFRLLLPKGIIAGRQGKYVAFNPFLVDGPPYGGLVGPVSDAARFLAAHLGHGELEGTRILSAESAARMRTRHASGPKLDAGYGWFRRGADRETARYWEHLGGGGGFWSMMRIYPERGIGVITMGNSTAYDHGAIAAGVVRDEGA
jgi:CubicO group peptidase (beta-lactamase class C family)